MHYSLQLIVFYFLLTLDNSSNLSTFCVSDIACVQVVQNCLLYKQCQCACVKNVTGYEEEDLVVKKIHVFDSRTSTQNLRRGWKTFNYSVQTPLEEYTAPSKILQEYFRKSEQHKVESNPDLIQINCTTAFWNNCTTYDQCKENCQTLEATSFRFFDNGCCECMGRACKNHGVNIPRCKKCRDETIMQQAKKIDIEKTMKSNSDLDSD